MKPEFFREPVLYPLPDRTTDPELRASAVQFCRRAAELWHAAALIGRAEPGLLTQADREAARRRGMAAGRRVLRDSPRGKARIAFYRALSADGVQSNPQSVKPERVWLLEDRCGLADAYLRGLSDTALQYGAECWICPDPLRRERLEAVFLPGADAVFFSMNAVGAAEKEHGRHVHLDRIPDLERKQSMRSVMKDNQKLVTALTRRAAEQLRNAEILLNLDANTCAVKKLRL